MPSLREAVFLITHPWLWLRQPLREDDLAPDPFEQFSRWYRRAKRQLFIEFPNAMTLSTVDSESRPDSRVVLLKEFDHAGFVFYTNLESEKAKALRANQNVALNFYWSPLQLQVRIQGAAEQVSGAEADAYFATRPRGSQLGAWASDQSQLLVSREDLVKRYEDASKRFADLPVPRPPHWGGFRVKPEKFEFWQMRLNRLHDRFVYTKHETGNNWSRARLYP